MKLNEVSLRERKHAGTKVALLRLMQDKLVKKPFEDISVKELCEGIPISEVTFFNYFPSKNDLLVYYIQIWSLEVDYHTKRKLKGKSGLKEIEYIFEHTAGVIEKIPNLMSEIIAFVTKNFTTIRFGKLSVAEKLIAFSDLPEIEKYDAVMLNDLFLERIKKAISEKEIPEKTDIEFLTFSLISIFFGTPIGWTRLEPERVKKVYKHNLELLWKGLKTD